MTPVTSSSLWPETHRRHAPSTLGRDRATVLVGGNASFAGDALDLKRERLGEEGAQRNGASTKIHCCLAQINLAGA